MSEHCTFFKNSSRRKHIWGGGRGYERVHVLKNMRMRGKCKHSISLCHNKQKKPFRKGEEKKGKRAIFLKKVKPIYTRSAIG